MNNLKTKIYWSLNNYCKSECSYCPTSLRGGEEPRDIEEYKRIAQLLITSYANLGRKIDWVINGGEPLDNDYFPSLLKLCKEDNGHLTLHTNGGKLWMDWWAIEPYVDHLYLSYHYWQQPALINYIIDTFQKTNKSIEIIIPMRPDHFDEDLNRAFELEQTKGIIVSKAVLNINADPMAGSFNYNPKQMAIMQGRDPEQVTEHQVIHTSWDDRYKDIYNSNPTYTGMMCNAGIEQLVISHMGWVSGSDCNNIPLGNIWEPNWKPSLQPQKCGMMSCISPNDQQITKFSQ
jgi:MoaA/NifB/PqqE/SkfB family radical SAM enzyme